MSLKERRTIRSSNYLKFRFRSKKADFFGYQCEMTQPQGDSCSYRLANGHWVRSGGLHSSNVYDTTLELMGEKCCPSGTVARRVETELKFYCEEVTRGGQ